MKPVTFETLTRNPELMDALLAQARRERAEAVHRLLIQPIKSFFTLGERHASRTDLAACPKG